MIVDRPAFEGGLWWAGQVHGIIDSVDSCQNIVEEIESEARSIISGRLPTMVD